MGLFAKNRPTKRIDLGNGDWVELQYLSKGIKDELKNEAAGVINDLKINANDGKLKGDGEISISGDSFKKLKEVEIRQMVAAIAEWSETEAEINFENVKGLSDEPYEKILEAILEMNELKEEEVKN